MSTRRAVSLVFVLLVAAGVAVLPAWADSQARIVRLSYVNGPVQIDRATGQGFEKAIVNMPVTQGMKLRTEGSSRAEVEFEDGTTLRLSSAAEVEFPQLALRSDGLRASQIRVDEGTVYFDVRHSNHEDFRLAFANQEIALDHSAHFRLHVDNDEAQLAVFKGEVALNDAAGKAKVKKNETLTLDLRDSGKFELAKGISPIESDTWDADRLNYHDYYASSNYGRSPYYYGRSDLNYYGSWAYAPGYGNVWRPFGVSWGWDPFSNGYWAWYPGGYTFVSGYPWGWSPYRYGSWIYMGGYGWCWRPGGWNNWAAVTPVYNAPPTYLPPIPPAAGAGTKVPPGVIIVNRGPGRKQVPDPDGMGNGVTAGGRTTARSTDSSGSARTAPANSMTSSGTTASTTTAVPPTPRTRSERRMIPGPDGPVPVVRSPRMRDSDGFGFGRPGGRAEGASRQGGGVSPSSPPRVSAPASAPSPRMSTPAPAPRMSPPASGSSAAPASMRGSSKSSPK